MDRVQPLVISQSSIEPFQIPFQKSFSFAGTVVSQRVGYYFCLESSTGFKAQGEAAPLPGISEETLRKTEHDLKEAQSLLSQLEVAGENKRELVNQLRRQEVLSQLCPSAKFAIESAIFQLAAQMNGQSLAEFLETPLEDVYSAALLQGTYDQVMADAKHLCEAGYEIFKLKVGDRNIPLDVKKVNDLRNLIGEDALLRLDGNRIWSLNEALLFMQLAGLKQIEFIEEPLSDLKDLNEFYQRTHVPVALDETLSVMRCGVTAPGRCSPTLAQHEAVGAYVLKPMILGGMVTVLDWIEEAKSSGKKAVISSSFETSVGIKVLANLALLTGQVAGLGTGRWLSGCDLVNAHGVIPKEVLK
jgi:O-succinylbenzoate synthase